MRVEATRLGYYGNKRIREGQQFNLKDEKHFSENWMIKVGQPVTKVKAKEESKKTPKFVDTDEPKEQDVI